MTKLTINGKSYQYDGDAQWSLLWYLRDHLKLTGTKFGCGKGLCGACTVHVGSQPTRSCILPLSSLDGQSITTIEGLAEGERLHPVQQAWMEHRVPQCGYCQPGQIMSAVALYNQSEPINLKSIEAFMSGNLCRCGTYPRIKKALLSLAEKPGSKESHHE